MDTKLASNKMVLLMLAVLVMSPVSAYYTTSQFGAVSPYWTPFALPKAYATTGTTATLQCSVISANYSVHWNYLNYVKKYRRIPETEIGTVTNLTVEWRFGALPIVSGNKKYEIEEVTNDNLCQITTDTADLYNGFVGGIMQDDAIQFKCITSKLIITNINNSDYGNYQCSVRSFSNNNTYYGDSAEVSLQSAFQHPTDDSEPYRQVIASRLGTTTSNYSIIGHCIIQGRNLKWLGLNTFGRTFNLLERKHSLAQDYWNITTKQVYRDGYTESLILLKSLQIDSDFSVLHSINCGSRYIYLYYGGGRYGSGMDLGVNVKYQGHGSRSVYFRWDCDVSYRVIPVLGMFVLAVLFALVRAGVCTQVCSRFIGWYRHVTYLPTIRYNQLPTQDPCE